MADRCPTDVKYEFHGMDMDIYKDFSPSEEYKMTEYQHGYQDGFQARVIYERSQAEPKSGRWLDIEPARLGMMYATCSECGIRQTLETRAKFCPNCGADMRERREDGSTD